MSKVAEGLAEMSDDPGFAREMLAARDEILGPKGLTVITSSYVDEATNATLADERLSAESKVLLKDVVIVDRPFAKWVKEWQAVAKELGQVEADRIKLEAEMNTSGQAPASAVRARHAWVRIVGAFLQMLDLHTELDDAVRGDIRRPLDSALAKVARRSAGSKGQAEAPPAPPALPSGKQDDNRGS
jgi:hypothetical protein